MPPKARPGGSTSASSSSSSNSSSSGSSSSSSSASDSSTDSESSQPIKKASPTKNPKKKEIQLADKNKKKNCTKKSGFVTNSKAPPRPISDDDSDTDFAPAKRKSSSKKGSKPKVVPKKSATAKTIMKSGLNKSKEYIGTESDSDIDDSMIKIIESPKKNKFDKKKAQQEKKQKSVLKKAVSKKMSKGKLDTDTDNSLDNDISLIRDLTKNGKNSPSPPTLIPQRQKQNKNAKSQKKILPSKQQKLNKCKLDSRKFRNSSVESIGDSSIESINHLDSESGDSDASIQQKMKKIRPKKVQPMSPKKKVIHSSVNTNKVKTSAPVSTVSDTDTEASAKMERPTTRKQTRGTKVKKSVHITGRRADGSSESESDPEDGGVNPSKKTSVAIARIFRPRPQYPPIENRKCPVPGCDSIGHLSGKVERHFTHDACPLYHNTTALSCKENLLEYSRKDVARKKALATHTIKSPILSPSPEQKKYHEKVKEERAVKEEPMSQDEEDEVPFTERERNLNGLVSNYDLALFREAQAKASKEIEDQLKGLPDVKGTKYMEMGRNEMVVWYQSPYPEEYTILPKIYVCEFCLKYMKAVSVMKRHSNKCVWKHPPGDEIYRKDKLSVFEVCGKKYKQYCQKLCLIAKSFLDHKTLYYDVEPFLFYVMTVADSEGCHIVGYFSKEKNSFLNYNVSCILTLPPYQRQGYGRLLIDFSYLLSKMEGKIGSPEKPLSDLGLISYRAYWKDIILYYLCNYPDREISFKAISEEMGIQSYDIVSTLQFLGMIKYWRGKHVILKKEDIIEDYLERTRRRAKDKEISAEYLKWKPYEPSGKEKRQAEQIKRKQEERQKGR